MAKKKKTKYSLGGTIPHPNTALQKNNIMWANAMSKADSGLTKALDFTGTMAQQVGQMMMSQGAGTKTADAGTSKFNQFMTKNGDGIASASSMLPGIMNMFAYGGSASGVPIEVEGEEVAETPNGKLMQFLGPSHEEGGIDVNVPSGTDIYSDRITVDGMTMAERKKLRAKRENKASKGKDPLSKSTRKRIEETNKIQDDNDKEIQAKIGAELEAEKYAFGSGIFGVSDDPTDLSGLYRQFQMPATTGISPAGKTGMTPTTSANSTNMSASNPTPGKQGFDFSSLLGNFTAGDALGMFGNFYQANKAKDTVLQNRATDTPNINAFENYGKNGLETLDKSAQFLMQNKDKQKADLDKVRVTSSKRNRNSARGINTMRALDLATDNSINQASAGIEDNFAKAMMNFMMSKSQMQNQQDQVVMQGEQGRDLADRQDKDNFYTQLGKAETQYGQMLSQTGKNLNQKKTDKSTEELMNQMFDYVKMNGNQVVAKDNIKLAGNDSSTQISTFAKNKGYEQLGLTKKEWDALTKEEKILRMSQIQ